MRNIFIVLLFLLVKTITAQDVIILNDNTTILSKVLEVNSSEVKYKKHSNLNGPIYTLSKEKIVAINYENGEKETFRNQHSSILVGAETSVETQQHKSSNNDSLIALHNKRPLFASLKQSRKKAKEFFPIMAITEQSILSTNQIEMKFVPECVPDYDFNNRYRIKYYIRLRNKTDKIIYIDKAQCFRKDNNGASIPFFDTKQVSIAIGSQGGIGVGSAIGNGAGIMGIGGGISNMQTSTYSQQRFIFIPPNSEVNLSEYVYDRIRKVKSLFTKNYKTIFDIETWEFDLINWQVVIYKGEVKECSEADTPYKTEYHIIYSTDKEFNTYSVLNARLYAKYLVGKDYNNLTEVFSFNRIKKYIPNFVGVEECVDILIGQPSRVKLPRVVGMLAK